MHSTPATAKAKVKAAFDGGCRRIDGAVRGFGGCPMAKDDLTGNMATETIIEFLNENEVSTGLDESIFKEAINFSNKIFLT